MVYIPTVLQALTGGRSAVEVEGGTVGEVIENLDRLWPGIGDRLVGQGRLRPNISVAVDGEGRLNVFVKGSGDGQIHWIRQNPAAANFWDPWQQLGDSAG